MKIAAVSMAYNDEAIIKGTIKCLQPFIDRHIIMLSEKPFYGEPSPPDRTEEICQELGTYVVKGFWPEHEQRNLGIKLCNDCDWIICFDSDEMMTYKDLQKFIQILVQTNTRAIAAHSKVYWKTTDYRLEPSPDHKIIIAVRPTVKFWEKRNVNCSYEVISQDQLIHHHLSWCKPKDIYKKVINCNHANEYDGKRWYREHFMKWKPSEDAIEPFGTKFKAVSDPLPQELKNFLYENFAY